MKELVTEEGADAVVLILCGLVTLGALAYGFWKSPKARVPGKRVFWFQTALCALLGPVIWGFWKAYNSIENYYGLDSLKALKLNFFIAVGIALVFVVLYSIVPKWLDKPRKAAPRK